MGQRNWYLHSSNNETFRCGRSYASTLMACDEGERGKGGKEGGGVAGGKQSDHFTLITLKSRSDRNTSR